MQHDSHHRLINILKQKPSDREVLSYAVECVKKTNSFEYTVAYIRKVEKQAKEEISRLGGNQRLSKIIEALGEAYKDAPASEQ